MKQFTKLFANIQLISQFRALPRATTKNPVSNGGGFAFSTHVITPKRRTFGGKITFKSAAEVKASWEACGVSYSVNS